MPPVLPRARRAVKPPIAVGLNRAHPLARSLIGWWSFQEGGAGGARDLVSGVLSPYQANPAPTWVQTPGGLMLDCGTSAESGIAVAHRPIQSPASFITIVAYVIWRGSTGGYQSMVRKPGQFILGAAKPGNLIGCTLASGGFHDIDVADSNVPTNVPVTLGLTYDGATETFWVNGVAIGTSSFSGALDAAANQLTLGAEAGQPGGWNGRLGHVWMWGRALRAAELLSLTCWPHQMFAPPAWQRWPLGVSVAAQGLVYGACPDGYTGQVQMQSLLAT